MDLIDLAIVHVNKRVDSEDFNGEFRCSFCKNFSSQVITLPQTPNKICNTCLNELSEKLNKHMRDNFKNREQ